MRILRALSSFQLECGCVGGVYELYSGEVVRVLDAHASRCGDARHRDGARLPDAARPPGASGPGEGREAERG